MLKLLVSFAYLVAMGSVVAEECDEGEMCPIPYTPKMQQEMLDYHNAARRTAKPTATDMEKIYWDKTLAKMALAHAKKCVFAHNTGAQRRFAGHKSVGQNLFITSLKPNASFPAMGWYAELQWFHFGKKTKHVVGHYTQLMQGKAARVGCGGAYCPHLKLNYLVTCNYLNGQYDYTNPYKEGPTCAACPGSCKDKLCDCNGRVCEHGGTLNLNTCKCKCIGLSGGASCEKIFCRKSDNPYCRYYVKYCDIRYGFSVRDMCPHTCGLCH